MCEEPCEAAHFFAFDRAPPYAERQPGVEARPGNKKSGSAAFFVT